MKLKGEDYGMRAMKRGTYNSTTNNIEINFDDFVDHIVALIDMSQQGFLDKPDLFDHRSIISSIIDKDVVENAWNKAIEIWDRKEGVITDSAKIKDDAEELDVWAIGDNYDTNLDVVTEEQLGMDRSYHTLLKNVRDAERFNYHSDYWGSAEGYQDTAISIMEELEPYVGQYVTIPYDDMEEGEENKPVKVLGLLIDKQYNSHLKVLIEE